MASAPEQVSPRPFEEGGLPPRARQRVTVAARDAGRFFTSTFTVAEMAIARIAGYAPVGQVMGSSIYHVGWSSYVSFLGGELDAITHAQREARTLALGRMEEEATALGAHAVIGVELAMRGYEWSGELMEFTAVGTAVRLAGREPTPGGRPALTHLTAQELYKLELAGSWPLGIALGNCTWYDRHADCASDGSWFNQELPGHTRCITQARDRATARFRQDIARLGAAGAVGVTVQRSFVEREWEENDSRHTSFKAEVLLLGTAVVPRQPPRLPRPRLVLDLGDRQIDLNDPQARARAELVRKT